MGAQSRFDVRDRNGAFKTRQGSAHRARRVPLDNQEIRFDRERWHHCLRDSGDVRIGVFPAWATEPDCRYIAEAVFAKFKSAMLARQNDCWRTSVLGECRREGSEFYGFWPRADDEGNLCGAQPSP